MSKWPKERQAELEAMKESGVATIRIAELVGVSEQVASYHLKGVEQISDLLDLLPVYPEEMLKIPDRACALTSDWHSPYFSLKWVRRLFAVCQALEVRDLAIVGDFTDFGWISRFVRKETRGSLAADMRITQAALGMLTNFFDDVWWSYGNHEDRLPAALGGQDLLPAVAGLATRPARGELHMTDLRTMLLGDEWRLEHPKTFSRDAAKVAAAAGSIFHKHIACAHGHHFGFKYDVSGRFLGIDLGGLFDESRQEYLFKSGITTLPAWNPGFWVYKDARIIPFEDAFVDWAEWGTE